METPERMDERNGERWQHVASSAQQATVAKTDRELRGKQRENKKCARYREHAGISPGRDEKDTGEFQIAH